MNLQPASKGPFVDQDGEIHDAEGQVVADFISYFPDEEADVVNARYFAHAANVLPKLIEALGHAERGIWALTFGAQSELHEMVQAALDAARGER